MTADQDSRAAFEKWYLGEDRQYMQNMTQEHARIIWQAAIAWATAQQAERERRLVDFMLDQKFMPQRKFIGDADRFLSLFNAAEKDAEK